MTACSNHPNGAAVQGSIRSQRHLHKLEQPCSNIYFEPTTVDSAGFDAC